MTRLTHRNKHPSVPHRNKRPHTGRAIPRCSLGVRSVMLPNLPRLRVQYQNARRILHVRTGTDQYVPFKKIGTVSRGSEQRGALSFANSELCCRLLRRQQQAMKRRGYSGILKLLLYLTSIDPNIQTTSSNRYLILVTPCIFQ
jgi:hypothetical protein